MKVIGFSGWSGSGKTTLIERLIPRFVALDVRVSLIKHAHHTFDVDHPGKDSYRHRHAGCTEVLVTSRGRWALMHEVRDGHELSMRDAIDRLSPCDLVLVEGYKRSPLPKLEIFRRALGKPLLHPGDPQVVALATDDVGAFNGASMPIFPLDAYDAIATFVLGKAVDWPQSG